MSTKISIEKVLNQMLKGPRFGRVGANKHQIAVFARAHEEKVRWVLARIPKKYSAAVAAVLVKALIYYGPEKVDAFCNAIQKMSFKGPEDPAHKLWLYLLRPQGNAATPEVYTKTVHAVKAYMEGRQIPGLRNLKKDIFEWDEDFTLPDELVERNDVCEKQVLFDNAKLEKDDEDIEDIEELAPMSLVAMVQI